MNKVYCLIFSFIYIVLSFDLQSQVVQYQLYNTDFSNTANWNLGAKTNKWIINNQYNCSGTLTANTPNNGGGNYLHVYSETALPMNGGTCACYNQTNPTETVYANFTSSINTIGFDSVVVSFDWICGGNAGSYGFLQISNDGGQNFVTITNPRQYYNSQTTWTNMVIHSNHVPQLLNNPSLVIRFGFTSGSTRNNPSFGIDNLSVRAFSTTSQFRTHVVNLTNELCSNTNTGSARVLATGGQKPYNYQWYNVTDSQVILNNDSTISNLKPGNYRVIITDALNQADTSYFVIQSIYPSPIITAGANDTICQGETVGLTAQGGVYYTWEPSSEIVGSNQLANPTAAPENTTAFVVTAKAPVADMIVNGNFSGGNTGFTSEYTFFPTFSGGPGNMNDGNYAISNCPSDANGSWWQCNGLDHTGGAGEMLIVNGASTAGVSVWCQTHEVMPNTDYAFSTWLSTMHPQNPAILQFSINGQLLGSPFNASSTICEWNQFYEIWNSQHNTIASICIVNMNTAISGNDFALDDISFSPLCPGKDTTIIAISHPLAFAGNDTLVCNASEITLSATGGDSYRWNTVPVSTTQQITVSPTVPTSYSVTVTDRHGCTAVDDVMVTIGTSPEINLGADTVLCFGNSLQLNVVNPLANSYLWEDGSTNPERTISQSGTYFVTVFSDCGNVTDSISVVVTDGQNLTISGDTAICQGETAELTASAGFESYIWSTSEAGSIFTTQQAGNFSVTATDINGCTYISSSNVIVHDNPQFSLSDVLVCNQMQHDLNGPSGMQSYLWSNSATSQSITVSTSGQYSLTVTDNNSCTSSATANISFGSINNVTLGNDTVFCESTFSLRLSPGDNFSSYAWSNGQSGSQIDVNQAGIYTVTVSDNAGCSAQASIQVLVMPLMPIYLGDDVNICNIESLVLDAGQNVGNYSYLWSNGMQNPSIIVTQAGVYWVRYGNENCVVSDTIEVIACPDMVVPNVFTPNGDGYNDFFAPEASAIEGFVMVIYNRWGTAIFETTDYVKGWDGTSNGKELAEGVYYWIIRYRERFSDASEKTMSGSVSLIR